MNNIKIFVGCLVALVVMLLGVLFFNKVSEKTEEESINSTSPILEYNNVSEIDSKLGQDIRISQSYLANYIIKKGSVWYRSEGTIQRITEKNNVNFITVEGQGVSITCLIDKEKFNYKKGDSVQFVGTIDLETGNIHLAKISTEEINYSSAKEMELKELVNHIEIVRNNVFTVSGFLVTEGNTFKLFDSKDSYENNNKAGNYFIIGFRGNFNYTGNQKVLLKCNINNSYSLKNCELVLN